MSSSALAEAVAEAVKVFRTMTSESNPAGILSQIKSSGAEAMRLPRRSLADYFDYCQLDGRLIGERLEERGFHDYRLLVYVSTDWLENEVQVTKGTAHTLVRSVFPFGELADEAFYDEDD